MTPGSTALPWDHPEWLDEVRPWIDAVLRKNSLRLAGQIEEAHRRPWSILMRIPTLGGDYYFKACSPALQHETALTRALARWQPGCVLPVLDCDIDRAWMILPDGGATLRSRFQSGIGIELWEQILPIFAELQISMVPRAAEMLDLGIIDRRLRLLPGLFETLLNDQTVLRVGKKDGLSADELASLKKEMAEYRELCGRLSAIGIPETLEHDDFHDGNIFYRDERPWFFDWGESCLAHPFFSMVVGLNAIAYRFALRPDDPQLDRLRDAYLEPWSGQFSCGDLVKAFKLASQVGAVNRALTWHRVVSTLPARWRRQYADAVPGWLQEYLERRQRLG